MSPVSIKKVDGFQVRTPTRVHAKHSTKANAQVQANLLRGIEHGWKPTGKKRRLRKPRGFHGYQIVGGSKP